MNHLKTTAAAVLVLALGSSGCAKNRAPASVGATLRVVRLSRRTPSLASSAASRFVGVVQR